MRTPLTKYFAVAVSAALFGAGILTSAFAGPERIDSKDKMVMAPPPACDPRWYVSLGGSVDFPLGEFGNGVSEDVNGEADLEIVSRDWDDTHDNWWNIQGEVGYVLTNHIELFGTFRYNHADSKIVTGSVLDFGFFDLNFVSKYGDYDAFGGELGLRYFFTGKESRIRPYVSVSGGATFVSSIGLRADSEFFGTEFTAYDGPFYDDSIVPTASALLGVEFQVIPCKFSVGIDAGIRWQGELEGDDSAFSEFATNFQNGMAAAQARGANVVGNGSSQFNAALTEALSHMNNSGDNFTIPVTVYAKFRF